MYPACILHVSCRIHVSWVYPDVSQMYLKCSVTFQENTCILTFCMYFTRIPNQSKIHFGIHIRYIKIHVSARFLCVTLDTQQDTSRYIRIHVSWTLCQIIHQNTTGYKITIHVSWMRDTCEIHVSARVIKIHAGYIQDTWWDTCISNASRERCIWYEGDMRDTCEIHARYMYPQR